MTPERKSTMVSARLPTALVERVDFVTRNIDSDSLITRSAAVAAALEAWLPAQEERLAELGLIPKKVR
jgi:predicted transcriptional regulator